LSFADHPVPDCDQPLFHRRNCVEAAEQQPSALTDGELPSGIYLRRLDEPPIAAVGGQPDRTRDTAVIPNDLAAGGEAIPVRRYV
jgi:hypothetical protein